MRSSSMISMLTTSVWFKYWNVEWIWKWYKYVLIIHCRSDEVFKNQAILIIDIYDMQMFLRCVCMGVSGLFTYKRGRVFLSSKCLMAIREVLSVSNGLSYSPRESCPETVSWVCVLPFRAYVDHFVLVLLQCICIHCSGFWKKNASFGQIHCEINKYPSWVHVSLCVCVLGFVHTAF